MMTNKEKLAQMDTKELADWLCDTVMEMIGYKVDVTCCEACPVRVLCKKGSNGFRTWLEKEAKG